MNVILEGEVKEIAALVLAIQERQDGKPATLKLRLDGKEIVKSSLEAIRDKHEEEW